MRPLLKPRVVLAEGDGGYLAYDLDADKLHRLNALASVVVELADGSRTRDDILLATAPLAGAEGVEACADWIDGAVRQGLIVDSCLPHATAPTARELRRAADALRDRDRVLAAFLCQQRAVQLEADDPQQWYRLGELAHIVGRRDDARGAYERYHEARPDDAEVTHLLVALRDEALPARASDACIEQLYGYFAEFYDRNMCDELEYRAPELLAAGIAAAVGERRDLSALDAGCGTGLFGLAIKPLTARLVGIDLSAAMLERARERGIYDRVEQAELTRWFAREPTETFDVIAICDTLIYFGDLGQVLPAAAGHLRPGGVLAFTVEKGEADPFALTDSGRFTHHRHHVRTVAAAANLEIASQTEEVLRWEYGEPVAGWVTVLRRNFPSAEPFAVS